MILKSRCVHAFAMIDSIGAPRVTHRANAPAGVRPSGRRSKCPRRNARGTGVRTGGDGAFRDGRYTPFRPPRSRGRERRRRPVAAKTALEMAGAITGTPGSPMPVGATVDATM